VLAWMLGTESQHVVLEVAESVGHWSVVVVMGQSSSVSQRTTLHPSQVSTADSIAAAT